MPDHLSERELLRAALARTAECPPLEEIESDRAKSHVDACAFCKTELALLKSFRDAEVAPGDAAAIAQITAQITAKLRERSAVAGARAVESPPSWIERIFGQRWLRPAALALAGALLIAAVTLELRHRSPELNSGANGTDVLRSGALAISSPVGDVQTPPEEIRWEAVAGAARYRVHLMEVDQHELWSGEAATAQIAIPADVRKQIVPLKTLLIEVDALDANGNKVAQSEVVRFRVLQSFYNH